jgi:hypothetical protein
VAGPRGGRRPESHRAHQVRNLLLAMATYLVLSVLLWWNVWSSHPRATTTCGCGDSSLFTWFIDWPAYAMSHGLNPLYSTALFHPGGVNLFSNTAEVGIGIVLAPITWLLGPIATLNVALTLSPVLSATAMFLLLRRWVSWSPAAFAGGLLYGFSPFILISLTDAHLMLAMAPFPPLVVLCLDELLIRQRRAPLAIGVILGLLVAAQFTIGTEVLVITAVATGIGVVIVVVFGLARREVSRQRAKYALVGGVTSVIVAGVLLAYPVWFSLSGPAHLSSPIWGTPNYLPYGGTNVESYLIQSAPSALATSLGHRFGGYQAPTLSGQYFGIGLVAVLVIGLVVWWRDLRLWLFAVVGLISVPLSSGLQENGWSLWRLFVRFPQMENVVPSRFLLMTYLAAAVMLGLIMDHTRRDIDQWQVSRHGPGHVRERSRWPLGALGASAVALVSILPIAAYYSSGLPLTTQPVNVPDWFTSVAPHLKGRQVLLAFPVPFAYFQSPMTWQAVDNMSFDMAGGGGPGALLSRAGKEAAGQKYIGGLSASGGPQAITPTEITAVRQALDGWGVTTIVIPDPELLPQYDRLREVRLTAALMTAATGRQPVRQANAWVWTHVDHAGPPVLASTEQMAVCGAGSADGSVASILSSTACVLSASASQ